MPSVKTKISTKTSTQTKVLVATVAMLMFGLAAVGYGYGFTSFNIKKSAAVKSFIKPSPAPSKIEGCAAIGEKAASYVMGCCNINALDPVSGYCIKKSGCAEQGQTAGSFISGCCMGLENVGGICKQTCADFWEKAVSAENPSGKCCADLVVDGEGKCVAP
ncbi:MAG: hypothetical protein AAB386_03010 [Patescibacteria group bacterium]